MRFLLSLTIALYVTAISPNTQTPQRNDQPRTASISGRVTIGDTPAAGVAVILTQGERHSSTQTYNKTKTDTEGRYHVGGLTAGHWVVHVTSPVYIPTDKANRPSLERLVTLDEGEMCEGVDISLVRGGVITGRVTDADGKPVIAEQVNLVLIDEQKRKKPVDNHLDWEFRRTDDRGVYRIFGLQSGRYLVSVGENISEDGNSRASRGNYPLSYHPDATDDVEAKIVEIHEGEEATNVDIKLGRKPKTYKASGRVVDAETGKPSDGVAVYLGSTGKTGVFRNIQYLPIFTNTNGEFIVTGVKPANYIAFARTSESFSDQPKFEIVESDISGLEIKLYRCATLSGVALLEGTNDPAVIAKLARVAITAYIEPGSMVDHMTLFRHRQENMIAADDKFTIKGLRAGRARISFDASFDDFTLLRTEHNGVEVKDGIKVNPGELVEGVRVIIGYGTGVVRGQLKIINGALPEGWQLHASLRPIRGGADLNRSAWVDEKGRFTFTGLISGEYEMEVKGYPVVWPDSGERPQPPFADVTQRVTIAHGAETQVSVTLDVTAKRSEGRQ
ncbi:MAG: hypothetical protein L0226_08025 [Acidobacteria bacterium]|nr:hypothetical protein [Acidobacteriota bacterium]